MNKKIIIAADSSANLYSADFPGFVSAPFSEKQDKSRVVFDAAFINR